jgi:hypothetical protein
VIDAIFDGITDKVLLEVCVIKILDLRWPARLVVELFGPVALQQQQPAWIERTVRPSENLFHTAGRGGY